MKVCGCMVVPVCVCVCVCVCVHKCAWTKQRGSRDRLQAMGTLVYWTEGDFWFLLYEFSFVGI